MGRKVINGENIISSISLRRHSKEKREREKKSGGGKWEEVKPEVGGGGEVEGRWRN